MNYQKIYDNLIYHRKNNILSKNICYCETHHIIPRCIGGNDTEDNLVKLTAREHYIAHLLLRRIYNTQPKLSAAVIMMQCKNNDVSRIFKYNSKLYEKERLYYASSIKGDNHWTKNKIQIINKITLQKKWIKNDLLNQYNDVWVPLYTYYFEKVSLIYKDYNKLSFGELQQKYKFNWNDHYLKSLFRTYIQEYNVINNIKAIAGKTITESFLNNKSINKNLNDMQETLNQLYNYIFDIYNSYKNPIISKNDFYKKYGFKFSHLNLAYLKKNIPGFKYNNTMPQCKNNINQVKQMYEYCKQYGYRQTAEYYKNKYPHSLTYTALWKLFKRYIPNFNKDELSKRSDRVCIHKNNLQLNVLNSELQQYLDNGWEFGGKQSKLKNMIAVHKNNITKYIPLNELDFYICNGWVKGSSSKSTKNYKWMTNGRQKYLVNPNDIHLYIDKGFIFGTKIIN